MRILKVLKPLPCVSGRKTPSVEDSVQCDRNVEQKKKTQSRAEVGFESWKIMENSQGRDQSTLMLPPTPVWTGGVWVWERQLTPLPSFLPALTRTICCSTGLGTWCVPSLRRLLVPGSQRNAPAFQARRAHLLQQHP